jgi:hypothetical protein
MPGVLKHGKRFLLVATAFVAAYLLLCSVAGVFLAVTTVHPGRDPATSADQPTDWLKEMTPR